jgi:hypothetical protein
VDSTRASCRVDSALPPGNILGTSTAGLTWNNQSSLQWERITPTNKGHEQALGPFRNVINNACGRESLSLHLRDPTKIERLMGAPIYGFTFSPLPQCSAPTSLVVDASRGKASKDQFEYGNQSWPC